MIWSDEIVEKVGDIAGEEMDGIPSRSHLNAVAHRILIAIERDAVPRVEFEKAQQEATRFEILTNCLTDELVQLRDSVLRSEMTEEKRYDRRNGEHRFVTEWEPMP